MGPNPGSGASLAQVTLPLEALESPWVSGNSYHPGDSGGEVNKGWLQIPDSEEPGFNPAWPQAS